MYTIASVCFDRRYSVSVMSYFTEKRGDSVRGLHRCWTWKVKQTCAVHTGRTLQRGLEKMTEVDVSIFSHTIRNYCLKNGPKVNVGLWHDSGICTCFKLSAMSRSWDVSKITISKSVDSFASRQGGLFYLFALGVVAVMEVCSSGQILSVYFFLNCDVVNMISYLN